MVLQSSEERLSTRVPGLKLKSLRMKEADDQAAQLTPPRTPYGTCAPFCLVFTEPSFSGCLRPVPMPSPGAQSPRASALTAFPLRQDAREPLKSGRSQCARTPHPTASDGVSSHEGASWERGALLPWRWGINALKFDLLSSNFLRPRQILPEKTNC